MSPEVRSHRLVYGSAHMLSPGSVILDIARVSEARNSTLGCSGLLLYVNTGYFQVIEGPLAALQELFASLRQDRRHIIMWHEFSGPLRRRTAAELPLGYCDENEFRQTGLKMPSMNTNAAEVTETILSVAAAKYPSAVL